MNSIILRLIIRDLVKNKFYSFITIFGLAVGMAATILIYIYAQHEFSYDGFHKNANRIYRINSILTQDKKDIYPICIRLADSVLQKQVPEIEELFQIYNIGPTEVICDNKRFRDIPAICSDENIFKVFTVNFLQGSSQNALSKPYNLVITKSISLKIFGTIDVVGKTLKESSDVYTITGVIDDFPSTSHLRIGAIASMSSIKYMEMLGGMEFGTYFLLNEKVNAEQSLVKVHDVYSNLLNEKFKESGYKMDCYLQNIKDIHLKSDFNSKGGFDAPMKKIYMYLSLALVVLLIAIINFINLLTAQYEGKSKEIGVQKAIGASRKDIIYNFLGKSIAFSFIALIIAIIIVEFFLPTFGNILNRDLVNTYRNNSLLIFGLPLLALITGFISGFYPAFIISKYPPTLAIKGLTVAKKGQSRLTQLLVIFQFSISIFLLACLFTINSQIRYMKNTDLGFNYDKVVAISDLSDKLVDSYQAIKDDLRKEPNIISIGASHHLMGGGCSGQAISVGVSESNDFIPINEYRVLPGFVETLGFKFIEGRAFDETIESDKTGVILNEKAVKLLGLSEPLKADLFMNQKLHVVGVIKDFHYTSFETSIEPIIFTYPRTNHINYIILKLKGDNLKEGLKNIENIIKKFDSQYELDYYFIEDIYHNKFKQHEQTEVLSSLASIISIVLALLGLYALAMYSVQKRTKEIGIRKVNGASSFEVVLILLSTYSKQVLISFVFAAPVAILVMNSWLNGFVYKVKFSPLILILSGLIVLVIALLTVLGLSWRVAGKNPVESLRYE